VEVVPAIHIPATDRDILSRLHSNDRRLGHVDILCESMQVLVVSRHELTQVFTNICARIIEGGCVLMYVPR
jgi:hypothetical protein